MLQLALLMPALTRRRLLALGAAGVASGVAACGRQPRGQAPAVTATTAPAEPGRISARPPARPPAGEARPGTTALGLSATRDVLLALPAGYDGERPAPLAVMLHGAGGRAEHALGLLQGLADAAGLILLAPASRGRTWDIILGAYGPDVVQIDRALAAVFARYPVDPARIAVGGFSDGASYALSLGLMNGDLFTHIIAFSPGFMAPERQEGQPQVFMSHGTRDEVLPIERCSRRILPQLEGAGYAVSYHEFEGGHSVPAPIAREAVTWFTAEA